MAETHKSCLVLEGGALRGVYTSGVQGVLHRAGLRFDAVIGTSAGALNGINYLSGQPERSFFIDYRFARDKNFMGLRPLLREGQIFSFQYMFGPVNDRFPLDLDAFASDQTRFSVVCTDIESGRPAFLERGVCSDILLALQGSASMPFLSTPVYLEGRKFLDGGPSMPVAYRKALEEGYDRVVVVLTRHKGYRKRPLSAPMRLAVQRRFYAYPAFCRTLEQAPVRYNAMMDEIDRLEAAGELFVLRPSQPVGVSRTEKNVQKLLKLFLLGRTDASRQLPALLDFLGGEEEGA